MTALKTKKLVCVTAENNNKFYNATENADGSISVEYGRVGYSSKKITYPAGKKKWNSLINSKLRKGYTDITSLKEVKDTQSGTSSQDIFKGVDDVKIISLIQYLMKCSSSMVKTNYLVATDDVTKSQIEEAQNLINETISFLKVGGSVGMLNAKLTKLYTVLPRKMKNVKSHLVNSSLKNDIDVDNVKKLIDSEQSLLSTLESQILTNTQTSQTTLDDKNILQEMGIEIEVETDKKMLDKVNLFLGQNKQYAKNIFKVTNHSTQKRFEEHLAKASNKEVSLLWHGSRNENILGIFQQGLKIRPTNAIHTGSMFDDGNYYAKSAQKSLGYTSLSGSYWANGSSNKGFLFLFSVHTGKTLDIYKHDSSCYNLSKKVKKEGYDSVFAHKGPSLRNDEIITYDEAKSTISYLIEMEK